MPIRSVQDKPPNKTAKTHICCYIVYLQLYKTHKLYLSDDTWIRKHVKYLELVYVREEEKLVIDARPQLDGYSCLLKTKIMIVL